MLVHNNSIEVLLHQEPVGLTSGGAPSQLFFTFAQEPPEVNSGSFTRKAVRIHGLL